MKKLFTKQFILSLLASYLLFEGIEHILLEMFQIDLGHILSLGGIFTILLFGIKYHILCCILPAVGSAAYCTYKSKRHCNHKHDEDHNHHHIVLSEKAWQDLSTTLENPPEPNQALCELMHKHEKDK